MRVGCCRLRDTREYVHVAPFGIHASEVPTAATAHPLSSSYALLLLRYNHQLVTSVVGHFLYLRKPHGGLAFERNERINDEQRLPAWL